MFGRYLGRNDFVIPPVPNTLFTRDNSCWIYGGASLNPMYWPARRPETLLVVIGYERNQYTNTKLHKARHRGHHHRGR